MTISTNRGRIMEAAMLNDINKLEQLVDLSSEDALRPMSDWEIDRVSEWLNQLNSGRPLSPKQHAKLNEIWDAAGPV